MGHVANFRPLDEIQWPRFKNKLMGNFPAIARDTDPLNRQLSIKLKLIENNEFNPSSFFLVWTRKKKKKKKL